MMDPSASKIAFRKRELECYKRKEDASSGRDASLL